MVQQPRAFLSTCICWSRYLNCYDHTVAFILEERVDIRCPINIPLIRKYSKRTMYHLAFIPTSLSALAIILACITLRRLTNKARDPVIVPALLPWVGNLLGFTLSPLKFLEDCR